LSYGAPGAATSAICPVSSSVTGSKSLRASKGSFERTNAVLICAVGVVNSTVWPSGFARATNSVAMMPLAPGRLSATTGCFHFCDSRSPTVRIATSMLPPGDDQDTKVTGRSG